MATRGQCSTCRAFGPEDRTSDFLCDRCADPTKIIHYCRGCDHRMELDPNGETITALQALAPDLPRRLGISIAVDTCSCCQPSGSPPGGQIQFFGIAPRSME